MTDRDLAADLHFIYCDGIGHPKRGLCHDMADRLIALGWHIHGENVAPCAAHGITHHMFACDGLEERLARALGAARGVREWREMETLADALATTEGPDTYASQDADDAAQQMRRDLAAAIAKAYREDTDDRA